jgi:flagellar hook-associated protein 3 FlgL
VSGAVGASSDQVSDYALRGQLYADSAATDQRIATLTQETASGLISDTYAGLGSGARTSLQLTPEIAAQKTVSAGISVATGRIGVAQNALTGLITIAQSFYAQTNNLNDLDASETDSVAAQARSALQQAAGLLDTADGAVYVFAGQDSANPPVPSPDDILSSGFYTQINTAVSALATDGAAATAAATLAVAQSNDPGVTPFSSYLAAAAGAGTDVRTTVETGQGGGLGGANGARVPAGIVADSNGDVVSTGTSTTGSYTRDILRALATLGSLSSAQVGQAGFQDLVQDVRTSLGGAITAIGEDAGALGTRQNELTAAATDADDTVTALKNQVGDVQDADLAQVSTDLSGANTQLQASYQLIAGLNKLSLVNYL